MTAGKDKVRERFDVLRARYLKARAKYDEFRSTLSFKYGSGYQSSWLKASDREQQRRLFDASDKVGTALTEHIASFSPRDWSYGVPQYWVRESLTYEDAARPVGEPLSVVPPVAWGYEAPRT